MLPLNNEDIENLCTDKDKPNEMNGYKLAMKYLDYFQLRKIHFRKEMKLTR